MPGKHYDVPSREEIEVSQRWLKSNLSMRFPYQIPIQISKLQDFFAEWQASAEAERKDAFVEFMKHTVTLSKLDNYTVITGIVTPPAAMAAKKAAENVPQINIIKAIPDVIFVPSVTVLALISAKISRKMIQGKMGKSAT